MATITLPERCQRVRMLLMDVDGVLTDGSIVYTDGGAELKAFHVRDGSGLKLWSLLGLRTGIITGRRSAIVERRVAELGIDFLAQGVADKREAFARVLAEYDLDGAAVCYVGDDVLDLPLLRAAGVAVAPADACAEARAAAHLVTQAPGGRGAVRETIETILQAQGRWEEVLRPYLT